MYFLKPIQLQNGAQVREGEIDFKSGTKNIEVIDMIVGSGRVDQETVHVGRLPGRPPPAELIWVENAAYQVYKGHINDRR